MPGSNHDCPCHLPWEEMSEEMSEQTDGTINGAECLRGQRVIGIGYRGSELDIEQDLCFCR